MVKNVVCFVAVVILCDSFVCSQIIIPVFHPRGVRGGKTINCTLPEEASDDYYEVRDFIYTFLEDAETDLGKMGDQEKMQRCQVDKGKLSDIMAKGKKDWAKCLTNDLAYFGDFVNDTLQNFLDFFCEKGNEHTEGYFNEEAKQCRSDIKKPLFDNCLVSLFASKEQINYDLSHNTYVVPGKRDNLCRKLLDIGPCTANLLESHCPHLTYYQQLSAKLFAETVKTCDGYVTYLSVAKVVGWTLTSVSVVLILVVRFLPVRKWYADFKHRASSKTLNNSVI